MVKLTCKVACLTFHDSSNYGAVLQAYALQYKLSKLGYNYSIINYSNAEKFKHDSLLKKNKELDIFHYFYKLLSFPYNLYKKNKFLKFSDKFLNITKKHNKFSELQCLSKEYDFIICGSDQVWNAEMVRFDQAYFLKFVDEKKKKIAYAASFGKAILNRESSEFYYRMLQDFDKISVREKNGEYIVKKIANKNAKVVLDPTLLLGISEWKNIAIMPEYNIPYILVYVLRHDPLILNFINLLKNKTGMKLVYISRGLVPMVREGATSIPSPEEWVGLFLKASFVVTNSFHGTAFSVNFNRPFFTFINGNPKDGTNSRIVDFLDLVGLRYRLNMDLDSNLDLKSPDFSFANKQLELHREFSLKFLRDSLTN